MNRKTWIWIGVLIGVVTAVAGVLLYLSSPRKLRYGACSFPEDEM